MKKHIKFLLFLVFAVCMTSCDNNDDTPRTRREEKIALKYNVMDVELGGPSEPNSVYIDLSTGNTKTVQRDAWQLGFYNGAENRVFLNASVLVTAYKSEFTDIDNVTRESKFNTSLSVKYLADPMQGIMDEKKIKGIKDLLEGLTLGYSMYAPKDKGIHPFTDDKQGTLDGTAIGEISDTPEKAVIYIISAGSKIPSKSSSQGAIATTMKETKGGDKGFYKIKVFMQDAQHYVIQYAQLDETKHKEAIIAKDDTYNLTFFSLLEGKTVTAAPPKAKFDINFSGVFSFYGLDTSHIDGKEYYAGVTYSDFVLTNNLGGTGAYVVFTQKKANPEDKKDRTLIPTGAPAFDDFNKGDVDDSQFIYDDRSVIGAGYRNPFKGSLNKDRYYIIKDFEGNIYKLQFTAFMDEKRERGHCQFRYELLQ